MVLSGANGIGKTNLLEAISLLSPGRGLRGADVCRNPAQGAQSSGERAMGGVGHA